MIEPFFPWPDLLRLSRRYAGGGGNIVYLTALAFLNVLLGPLSNRVRQRSICAERLIGGFSQIRRRIARRKSDDIDRLYALIAGYCQAGEFAFTPEERRRSVTG